jgi:8-oxo-dGTP diphosphatase
MRQWVVGGGLILGDDGLLLVRNRRRNGQHDWSPPGGVIDDGETLLAGLTREVVEETGVVVARWHGPVYEVEVEAPGLGWHLRVEAHVAVDFAGEVRVDDPDGIVVDAAFVDPGACDGHLAGCHPWVSEPLGAWLAERWDQAGTGSPRRFTYLLEGDDPASTVVTRR